MRMSLLTGSCVALHILYDDETADRWMARANRRPPFNGRTPVAYALESDIPGLLTIRRMLDAERGGQYLASAETRRLAARLPQPEIRLED